MHQIFLLFGILLGFKFVSLQKILMNRLRKYFNNHNVFLFGSARSALYLILKSLGLKEGDGVIVTGFTCEVVPNAIINAGYRPVYVDIDSRTLCTSHESIVKKISENTKAIIVQHSFGIPADLDSILATAREHGLYVIEDCAVSLLSKYKNKQTGLHGDAAIFSLELSKVVTCGKGGICLINNDKILNTFRRLYKEVLEIPQRQLSRIIIQNSILGILMKPGILFFTKYFVALLFKIGFLQQSTTAEEHNARLPPNYLYKLSGAQCAVLLRQFDKLEAIKQHSRAVASEYIKYLTKHKDIRLPRIEDPAQTTLIRMPILVNNREKWLEEFRKARIEINGWFTAPLSSEEIDHELFGYEYGDCPIAEDVAKKIINLPLHLQVNGSDIKRIVKTVETILQN